MKKLDFFKKEDEKKINSLLEVINTSENWDPHFSEVENYFFEINKYESDFKKININTFNKIISSDDESEEMLLGAFLEDHLNIKNINLINLLKKIYNNTYMSYCYNYQFIYFLEFFILKYDEIKKILKED